MPENIHPPANEHSVEIFKEKQKTIRRAITYGVVLIVGVLIIFLGGKLKFGKDGIEISKDVLQSTDQKKEKSSNGDFTTGDLNKDAKEFLEKNKESIKPGTFTGKNYINNSLGYLFSVEHPEKWIITYNPENASKDNASEFPVNTIDGGDGVLFKVAIGTNEENATIESIAGAFFLVFTELAKNDPSIKPEITYDKESQTAFFNGVNIQNYKRVLMKIVLKNGKGYFAYVEYAKEMEETEKVKELKHMVATLTAI